MSDEKLTDFLRGCTAIAEFLDMPGEEDKVYRMIEKKVIPVGRIGGPRGMLIGSKRRIAAAIDKIAAGETA